MSPSSRGIFPSAGYLDDKEIRLFVIIATELTLSVQIVPFAPVVQGEHVCEDVVDRGRDGGGALQAIPRPLPRLGGPFVNLHAPDKNEVKMKNSSCFISYCTFIINTHFYQGWHRIFCSATIQLRTTSLRNGRVNPMMHCLCAGIPTGLDENQL